MYNLQFIFKWLPYLALMLVYAAGANLDVMEVDAAQYASMSLEMLKSGNYLIVLDRLEDYLDKPPLLFWLSSLSMKLFGIGNWQYKLPSILFSLLGVLSTYQLGKTLYSEKVGQHASWIFGGLLATVMINNDVKTDTILVSAIVFSIWMMVSLLKTGKWIYIIGSALGISAAMLTKGPIGLMMPLLAIGGHIFLKQQWKQLLNWRWFPVFIIVGITLIPMCIGLYRQHGTEGLKFYFWTQSFGRITGESEWRNDTTPLYFLHIFLWSFLPWTILGIAALFSELKSFNQKIKDADSELFLISGIVLVWVALSLSKFKLPHYIFVVYPLVSILTAKYINQLNDFTKWARFQLIIGTLLCVVMAALLAYCFPEGGWWIPAVLILLILGCIIYFFNSYRVDQIVVPTFIVSIGIALGLNLHFYPQLLPYQANAYVGKWVVENGLTDEQFFGYSTGGRSLDFYAKRIVGWKQDAESTINALNDGTVVYTSEPHYNELLSLGVVPKREIVISDFEVQKLSIKFLNPKTREEALKKKYLLFY